MISIGEVSGFAKFFKFVDVFVSTFKNNVPKLIPSVLWMLDCKGNLFENFFDGLGKFFPFFVKYIEPIKSIIGSSYSWGL